MKEAEMKVAAEMQLGRFALKTHGLRMTEMRLRVLGFLEQADKFALLGMLDDMMDDLGRNGVRALGQNVQGLSKRQAMLLLTDLRRWWVVNWCCDAVENCDRIRDLQRRLTSVEAENAAMKARLNDGWTGRVTYESMVEQIVAWEKVAGLKFEFVTYKDKKGELRPVRSTAWTLVALRNMLAQWVHRGYLLQMTDDSFLKISCKKEQWMVTSDIKHFRQNGNRT